MNIEWVIPCRFVEVHDNLATIVGGGIDHFWVPQEPRAIGVMFALRLTAMADELGPDQPHQMSERIRDPSGNVIHEIAGELGAVAQGDPLHPEWLQGLSLAVGAQFEVPVEGTYTVTHRFDTSEHSLPLHVHHTSPPGVEPPT